MYTLVVLAVLWTANPAVLEIQELGPIRNFDPEECVPTITDPKNSSPKASPRNKALSKERKITFDVTLGLDRLALDDPFGQYGLETTGTTAFSLGLRLYSPTWDVSFSGQLLQARLRDRTVHVSVRRELFHIGSIRIGIGVDYDEARYRHDVFVLDGGMLGTARRARTRLGALEFGLGSYDRRYIRLVLLNGWYESEYHSVLTLKSSFESLEPLARDESYIYGARVNVRLPITKERIELETSLQYLRLSGPHSPSSPVGQISGNIMGLLRVWTPQRLGNISIGLNAHFNSARPPLLPNRSLSLHLLWRLK